MNYNNRNLYPLIKVAVAAAALLASQNLWAATLTVNTNADELNANGNCSLREALEAANTNAAVDNCGAGDTDGDSVVFNIDAALLSETITLGGTDLDITDDISIDGTNTGNAGTEITINGAASSRIFDIATTTTMSDSGLVNIQDLTMTNGSVGTNGGGIRIAAGSDVIMDSVSITSNVAGGDSAGDGGGGISNDGTLTISDSVISGNMANGDAAAAGQAGNGGGILNTGTLLITGSQISLNSAVRAGGGIENNGGSVTLDNTNLDTNSTGGDPGNGGGMHISGNGTAVLISATITGNTAAREGGGLWNSVGSMIVDGGSINNNTASGPAADDGGGGIFNNGGILTVSNGAVITNNEADGTSGSGGGIFNNTNGIVRVDGSTISNNTALRAGGGIEDASGNADPLNRAITISNTAITGNNAGGAAPNPGNGGGIHVTGDGSVQINGMSTINNNIAAREGGGLWNDTGFMVVAGPGTAPADRINIDGNSANGPAADDGGGGIFNNGGTLVVDNVNITNNTATGTSGSGGGIFNNTGGFISRINSSSVSNNTASRAGGGIEDAAGAPAGNFSIQIFSTTMDANNAGGATPAPGNGGAIHITGAGGVLLTNGTILSNNIAAREGGGLWNDTGVSTLVGTIVTGNTANGPASDDGGGGIFNNGSGGEVNVVSSSALTANTAPGTSGSGGGIFVNEDSTVLVQDSVVAANTAARAGGGIENLGGTVTVQFSVIGGLDPADGNITGNNPGNGGGIHTSGDGSVTVSNSTVVNNLAASEGGGLWNSGAGTLDVFNSTLSANTASGTGTSGGGGIFQQAGAGITTLTNITVANNDVDGGGLGGGLRNDGGTVTTTNSLFGDNTASSGSHPDFSGSLDNGDFNLIEDPTGTSAAPGAGANNILNQAPNLGPLQLNGGTTPTHALMTGSPAINSGDNATCTAAPVSGIDQRDFPRPSNTDDPCDIGAYEDANNPIVTLRNNGETTINANTGDTNVQTLAFDLENNSGETVTISGFSGALVPLSGDYNSDISATRLYRDINSNGVVDPGEPELTNGGGATITLTPASNSFTVTFTPNESLFNATVTSYLVVVDFNTSLAALRLPILAGSLMLLPLGFIALGGMSQRRKWLLVVTLIVAGSLSACSGGSSGDGFLDNLGLEDEDPTMRSFQFVLAQVQGTGDTTGLAVIATPLPIEGPTVTVTQN